MTVNFSGAEIEALIKAALYRAVFEHEQADTLSEFRFEQKYIKDTIGPEGRRTFRILYDSEFERLAAMREVARRSWISASSYDYEEVTKSNAKPVKSTSAFFEEEPVVKEKPKQVRAKPPRDASAN